MEVEIVEKRDNALLERVEIRFKVIHPGESTPSREAVREKLASSLRSSKEKVILDQMRSEFGRGLSEGYAKVYRTTEAAEKHERKHVLVRNKLVAGEAVKEKSKKSSAASEAKK